MKSPSWGSAFRRASPSAVLTTSMDTSNVCPVVRRKSSKRRLLRHLAMPNIVVITGVGGMGSVCARRLAQGRTRALIDCEAEKLDSGAAELEEEGKEGCTGGVEVGEGAGGEGRGRGGGGEGGGGE